MGMISVVATVLVLLLNILDFIPLKDHRYAGGLCDRSLWYSPNKTV